MAIRKKLARLAAGAVAGACLLAGVVAAPTTAGAATPENTAYVRSLYFDLLDRTEGTTDPAGVEYWAGRLDEPGQARGPIARRIMVGSTEYFGVMVDLNYALFFDRTADTGGRAYYLGRLRDQTLTLDQVMSLFASSGEYFNRIGGTNAAFVDAVYFDVLGREPDPGGRAFALSTIASKGRRGYTNLIVRSGEKRKMVISDRYGSLLGRPPTMAETDAGLAALGDGRIRIEELDGAIVSSDEYYDANT